MNGVRVLGLICFIINTLSLFSQYNGRVTVRFEDAFEGYLVLKEYIKKDSIEFPQITTIDSIEVKDNVVHYEYQRDYPNFINFVLHYKNGEMNTILFRSSLHSSFVGDAVLGASDAVIKVKMEGPFWVGIIEGSEESDLHFQLVLDDQCTDERGVPRNNELIRKYPNSQWLLSRIYSNREAFTIAELKEKFKLFSRDVQRSKIGNDLLYYLHKKENQERNGIEKEFVFYDKNDVKYIYRDVLRDKQLTLLIFGASWCAPCRAEIPELKSLYERYKDRVSFVSMSIDTRKYNWIKSVKEDKVPWLSLAGFVESNNKVKEIFNIFAVPCFIIIDKNGKIIFNGVTAYKVGSEKLEFYRLKDIEDILKKELLLNGL